MNYSPIKRIQIWECEQYYHNADNTIPSSVIEYRACDYDTMNRIEAKVRPMTIHGEVLVRICYDEPNYKSISLRTLMDIILMDRHIKRMLNDHMLIDGYWALCSTKSNKNMHILAREVKGGFVDMYQLFEWDNSKSISGKIKFPTDNSDGIIRIPFEFIKLYVREFDTFSQSKKHRTNEMRREGVRYKYTLPNDIKIEEYVFETDGYIHIENKKNG